MRRYVYGPGGEYLPDGRPHIRMERQGLVAVLWRAYRGWRRRRRSPSVL